MFRHRALLSSLITATLLAACVSSETTLSKDVNLDRAGIDIGDLSAGGVQVQSLATPPGYKQGDKLVAYEGPGWESDRIAYRLYLDGRNAVDIFGKRKPELVLADVGRGEDYHEMADWGMDILKVGNSLGAGGFGIFKDGEVVQIGEAARYSAAVTRDDEDTATLRVTHEGSMACGGDVVGDYTISGGSRLTDISIMGDCAYPYAAGLIIHPDTVEIQSSGDGEWAYLARYGSQSLVPDNLGLALFYRPADVESVGRDIDDSYIVFKRSVPSVYKNGAAWAQEPNGITTETDFRLWLDETRQRLNTQ